MNLFNKKWVIFTLIAVIIVAVLVGGSLYYGNQNLEAGKEMAISIESIKQGVAAITAKVGASTAGVQVPG